MDLERANQCWAKVQEILMQQIDRARYETWFKPLKVYSTENKTLVLHTEESFVVNFVSSRYKNTLYFLCCEHFHENFDDIRILCDSELDKYQRQLDAARLNPKYTFDTFIVGQSNRMAHAASMAVAECPGTEYNPLFIYGGAGLGKTHLITAIANYVLLNNPNTTIEFSNAEKFTNEVVEAIRQKTTQQLRNRMRSVDILFIDDIQFLTNRTATQEEFFNTFNELYSNSKQIVITSDRPPDEIATLEERMRSRFKSGIVVDIGKPDVETRMAILRSKASHDNIAIDEEAISYIAEKIDTNIRELEGGLMNASLLAKVEALDTITMDIARNIIKETEAEQESAVTPEKIILAVSKYYSVTPKDILSNVRSREFTVPRQLAIYLTRELCAYSTTKVGEAFGRDHSTVMHACKKVEEMIEASMTFRLTADQIRSDLGAKK
ncbi:MAG: chromosomal replication initiator protein DnaA [Clostridia bacterium]|nr:chromosomal replication initiator protein DnaA [Clostridia bacterium]